MRVIILIISALAIVLTFLILGGARLGTIFGQGLAIMAKTDFICLVVAQGVLACCVVTLGFMSGGRRITYHKPPEG